MNQKEVIMMNRVKEILSKYKFILTAGVLSLVIGITIGVNLFSDYKSKLGERLSEDLGCVIKYYRYEELGQNVENILEKDVNHMELKYLARENENIVDKLKHLTLDYTKAKGTDGIDERLDNLIYFTTSFEEDVLDYLQVNEEEALASLQDRRELIKVYLDIAEDFDEIINTHYPFLEDNMYSRSKVVETGYDFWNDNRWKKALMEIEEHLEKSNFRERREEEL